MSLCHLLSQCTGFCPWGNHSCWTMVIGCHLFIRSIKDNGLYMLLDVITTCTSIKVAIKRNADLYASSNFYHLDFSQKAIIQIADATSNLISCTAGMIYNPIKWYVTVGSFNVIAFAQLQIWKKVIDPNFFNKQLLSPTDII